MVETCCPLILVTTLLLVVKHSASLSVVTGLVVVWVSLTVNTTLLDCDTTKMLCCLWGEQLIITDDDDFWSTVVTKPANVKKLKCTMYKYTQNVIQSYISEEVHTQLPTCILMHV